MNPTNKEAITAYQRRKFIQTCLTKAKDVLRRAEKRVRHLEQRLSLANDVDEIFEGIAMRTRWQTYMTCVAYSPRRAKVWKNVGVGSPWWGLTLEYTDIRYGNIRQAYSSCMFSQTEEQALLAAKRYLAHNEVPVERYATVS